jgi:hypothetical protein
MNLFQKSAAAVLIAVLLVPVALKSGLRRFRARRRPGRVTLAHHGHKH